MKSRALDPNFRDGAATRMLGTLWVLAPADLLEAGDSEEGLALLEGLVAQHPDVPDNHLRLAEALVALDDDEAAHLPLCRAGAGRARLRRDHQALLDRLVSEVGPLSCAPSGAP